jgi:hypothetical protein
MLLSVRWVLAKRDIAGAESLGRTTNGEALGGSDLYCFSGNVASCVGLEHDNCYRRDTLLLTAKFSAAVQVLKLMFP